jgi:multisubunit Na+/H+ antiporter MnhE subunit
MLMVSYPNQIRQAESFNFAKRIARPYGELDPIIDWCRTELQNDWRWQLIEVSNQHQPGRYIFYFDSERDFCAFLLKWG